MDFAYDNSVYNRFGNGKRDQDNSAEPIYKPFQPLKVIIDPMVLDISRPDIANSYFPPRQFNYGVDVVRYQKLNHYSLEYKSIERLFSNISYYTLTDVEKVFNPYLKKKFELKRQLIYGGIQPITLFHGTKEKYINSICNNNFDWRHYCENGHRYGKGVNFTPELDYAAIYCDKRKKKVMIMADVLVRNIAHGRPRTIIPPPYFDSTEGKKGVVIVKYDDSEFYPKYLLYFVKSKRKKQKLQHIVPEQF